MKKVTDAGATPYEIIRNAVVSNAVTHGMLKVSDSRDTGVKVTWCGRPLESLSYDEAYALQRKLGL